MVSGFETIRYCFHCFCSRFSYEKTDERKVGYNSHFFNLGNPSALLAMQRRSSNLLLCDDEVGEVFLFFSLSLLSISMFIGGAVLLFHDFIMEKSHLRIKFLPLQAFFGTKDNSNISSCSLQKRKGYSE